MPRPSRNPTIPRDLFDLHDPFFDNFFNDPAFAPARFNLGLLLLRRGRKSDGLAQVREAVRLDASLARRPAR